MNILNIKILCIKFSAITISYEYEVNLGLYSSFDKAVSEAAHSSHVRISVTVIKTKAG